MTSRLETAAYMLGFTPEEARMYMRLAKDQYPDQDDHHWETLAISAMKLRREHIALDRAREGNSVEGFQIDDGEEDS